MAEILLRGPVIDNPLYDCRILTKNETDLSHSIHRTIWGFSAISYGTISMILYFFCLLEMAKPKNYQHACYKIMFFNGCVDMLATFLNNSILGFCIFVGISFCDFPDFLYLVGCIDTGTWGFYSFLCLILAFNRLLEILEASRIVMDWFFSTFKIYLWLLAALAYGVFFFACVKPPLYVNTYGILSFDPNIYPNKAEEYDDKRMVFNNFIIVVVTFVFYGLFLVVIWRRRSQSTIKEKKHHKVFFQTILLCGLNLYIAFSCLVYHHLESIAKESAQSWLIAYQISTGLPPFIFLSMNQSIRKGAVARLYSIFGMAAPRKVNVSSISSNTLTY